MIRLFFGCVLLVLVLTMCIPQVFARGTKDGDVISTSSAESIASATASSAVTSTLNSSANLSTGDTVVGGSSMNSESKAFALGLGGVDISDCLYSWQFLFFQGVKLNKWCAAEAFAVRGYYTESADMYCRIPQLSGRFKESKKLKHQVCVQTYRILMENSDLRADELERLKSENIQLRSQREVLLEERKNDRDECNESKTRILESCQK